MITLYDCATAPSPRRARIFLAEKGVPHDTVQIDLRNAEQMGEAYRQINPQCTVPALRTEEGTLLTDNAAIAAYLEARYPEPPLLGRTPHDKAEIASWQWRVEFEGLMAVADAFRNGNPAMTNRALPGPVDYPQIAELAQRGLARVQHFFHAQRTPRRTRFHRRPTVQRGGHHRRGHGRLCASHPTQARRRSSASSAMACGDGPAVGDGRLNGESKTLSFCWHEPRASTAAR